MARYWVSMAGSAIPIEAETAEMAAHFYASALGRHADELHPSTVYDGTHDKGIAYWRFYPNHYSEIHVWGSDPTT